MIFNSVTYLFFFPAVVLLYFLLPHRFRNLWLLAASFLFYMNWNAAYGLLLFGSILVTYLTAVGMEKTEKHSGRKAVMLTGLVLNLGALIYFKYSGFLVNNLNHLLPGSQIQPPDILLPVGISFYIFQALGYTLDVYYQKIRPEKNFFRYALFVSFFPQLVAGPIERSRNLLPQFEEKHTFDVDRVRRGLLLMLWGLFMKIVIADRLCLVVDTVFDSFLEYNGMEIILSVALFTIQIYCDFSGYSYIAIGSALVMGFTLMENFHHPFLSSSIHQYWKNWHISLTSWFTDYVYIPLGGNRKGKLKKYRNTFLVFLISGLWHGAAWNYVIWGGLNGILMVLEEVLTPVRNRILAFMKVDKKSFSYRFFAGLGTFGIVVFTFLIFRAPTIAQSIAMLRQIKARPSVVSLFGESWSRLAEAGGLSGIEPVVCLLSILLLLLVDVLKLIQKDVAELVLSQSKLFRWMVYLLLLGTIILFGIYGNEYTQTAFIYFQF